MFEKIVIVDPTGLNKKAEKRLADLGKTVNFYTDIPKTEKELIQRIGDADCILVSYNTQIGRHVIE